MTQVEFERKKAEVLRGGTIMNVFTDSNDEFWGIQVLTKDKVYAVWINRDPEGNGPGSIEVMEDITPA